MLKREKFKSEHMIILSYIQRAQGEKVLQRDLLYPGLMSPCKGSALKVTFLASLSPEQSD